MFLYIKRWALVIPSLIIFLLYLYIILIDTEFLLYMWPLTIGKVGFTEQDQEHHYIVEAVSPH